ncbi:DUF3592 domain-containing protein [Allorhizocola rhizosphaerae]|uniref:DUF3592 domain-containing protein n=1 Tax=Allorhizocola rhizosphaerae TaxID=1872709 RepID=UPI000E3BC00D|nr:DUF3592 domain-containing protein [Allorhizocola rhizosphaerae]
MGDNPAPIHLARRFAFVAIGLVGLIFLVIGGWLLLSLAWVPATGTVGACQTHNVRTGTSPTSKRTEHVCQVTWEADGGTHRASVNLGTDDVAPGQTVELRVNGDDAVVATPAWLGAATAAAGAALIAVAAILMLRARRRIRGMTA